MKAVLISIKPKYCELIANGKKMVEVRKTRPKLETPFKVYIYCTTGNKAEQTCFGKYTCRIGNGKVIGEFVCDRIYHIKNLDTKFTIDNDEKLTNNIALASCLDFVDMKKYLGNKDGYAWHIIDLVIYDKPKELGEFYNPDKVTKGQCVNCVFNDGHGNFNGCNGSNCYENTRLKRPPQSWCYVEELGV